MKNIVYEYRWVDSPVGKLCLVAKGDALAAILWQADRPGRVTLEPRVENRDSAVPAKVAGQLGEYFSGRLSRFDVPLDFKGTAFQKTVWAALLTIPYGETRTYGEIARQIGYPTAVRAVGAANGRNPISIIAPCHRVIGSTGKLTGFAGGLHAKEVLLAVEGSGVKRDGAGGTPDAGQLSLNL